MAGSWQSWVTSGLILATVGCGHFRSKKTTPVSDLPVETRTMSLFGKSSETNEPKPDTYIALGEVRLAASRDMNRAPLERENLRNESRRAYQAVLEKNPESIPAIRGMAQIYEDQGMKEQAIAFYAKITELTPKDSEAWFTLAICQGRKAKDWQGASESFSKAIELEPDNQRYRRWLGWTLAAQGQTEDAAKQLMLVMPENEARLEVAEIAHLLNRQEVAREQISEALRKDPNNNEIREIYSALHQRPVNPIDSEIRQAGAIEQTTPVQPR